MDILLVYSMIRRLTTPFNEWKAYDLGIIDKNGKILKSRKDLATQAERKAFGIFDLMILKLKKLLQKVPGGNTKLGSYAAALWLIKEHDMIEDRGETLTEEDIMEAVGHYHQELVESININFYEEMSVGAGVVAGVEPDEPPVSKKKQKEYKKANHLMRRKK